MEDNSNPNVKDLIRKFTSNETSDYIVSNKSKIILNKKIVNRIITLENLKISALKMLIPFIFYLFKLKLFQKQNQIITVTDSVNLNKFKVFYPFLLSLDLIYFIIHFNRNLSKNKKFVIKEFGKIIIKASLSLLGGIGLSFMIKETYLIGNPLCALGVELFSMFTSNFLIETLCDKLIGTKSKKEIYLDKIQNSDHAFNQSLHCLRVNKNVDEITLTNIKNELFNAYNPDKFSNEELKDKARKKIRRYQAAYDIIKTRIYNKTNQ